MKRRKFSREFKIKAVRLVTDRGVAVAQANSPSRDNTALPRLVDKVLANLSSELSRDDSRVQRLRA